MALQNLLGDLALDASIKELVTRKSNKWKWSFAKGIASGIDTSFATLLQTGTNMTVSQSAGNLVITTGTNPYSETVIRSNSQFGGAGVIRYLLQLSQRIANQNFALEFTDIVGDGLAMVINSATSITVTKTAHGFDAGDVGKGLWVSMCSVAACPTQRATIASIVDANNITLTVAGFPASGSGTCSLFGYNYHQVIYSGTTATNLGTGFSSQRLGWANVAVNPTINSTGSPGHIGVIETSRNNDITYLDQIVGSSTSAQTAVRACFNQNVPDEATQLYFQLRVFNGSVAPASSTTLTVGFIDVEMYSPAMVNVSGVQSFGYKNAIPVAIERSTATINASGGTVTVLPSLSTTTGHATTFHHLISAATNNATSVKASAGTINSIILSNNGASAAYFKLYNKASAPTVGTDTPIETIMVPAGQTVPVDCGFAGWRLSTGIAYAVVAGMPVADNTAIAAAQVSVGISYA